MRSGAEVAQWDGAALAALPEGAIRNAYPYAWASKFKTERDRLLRPDGARAVITLPPPAGAQLAPEQAYTLVLEAIDGAKWQAPVATR